MNVLLANLLLWNGNRRCGMRALYSAALGVEEMHALVSS
jgi:hypothetical protein